VNTPLFQKRSVENPDYKWTMHEQIELAVDGGSKVFNVSEKFEYSETNYLLLAQIIENITQKPFYEVL
ncbi:MAG: serine hydrolase, partial [Bacteroidia bacterium]